MNAAEIEALLRAHDDPVHVEQPSDFDEAAERRRTHALAHDLRNVFGEVEYEVGGPAIQDATFFAWLRVPAQVTARKHGLWLRVSNFGNLAAAGVGLPDAYEDGDLHDLVDPREWRELMQALQRHGYTFVPEGVLFIEYDGRNDQLISFYAEVGSDGLTWWSRYFDWL